MFVYFRFVFIFFVFISNLLLYGCSNKQVVSSNNIGVSTGTVVSSNNIGVSTGTVVSSNNIGVSTGILYEKNKLKKSILKYGSGSLDKLDCGVFFSKEVRRLCEETKIKDFATNCYNLSLSGIDNISTFFSLKKFPDLSIDEISVYKDICISQLSLKKYQSKVNSFNLDKCILLANKFVKLKYLPLKLKKYFIDKCKLSYAITYKNDCSIIKDRQLLSICRNIKRDIDYYKFLNYEYTTYGKFNLYPLLQSKRELMQDGWFLDILNKSAGE